MKTVEIRNYEPQYEEMVIEDIISFWKTHNANLSPEGAKRDLQNWIGEKHELFLIFADDILAGFVHLGSRGGACDWLEDIFVKEIYQGQGIGSSAIQCVWDRIRAKGLETLYLEVVPANIEAIKLYHKLGFTNLNSLTLNKSVKKKEVMGEETIQGLSFKTYRPNNG